MSNRLNGRQARAIPEAGSHVECILEDGTRFGPLELAGVDGNQAVIRLECGVHFPVPTRTIVASQRGKRRAGSASGERVL